MYSKVLSACSEYRGSFSSFNLAEMFRSLVGHGISIGSIASDKAVSGVTISGNTITDSVNGLRIKTVYGATDASVKDVVYSGNTASGITSYGVVIEQDYENGSPTGTPSNGVTLGPVTFSGTNTIAVSSGAKEVYVLCGTEYGNLELVWIEDQWWHRWFLHSQITTVSPDTPSEEEVQAESHAFVQSSSRFCSVKLFDMVQEPSIIRRLYGGRLQRVVKEYNRLSLWQCSSFSRSLAFRQPISNVAGGARHHGQYGRRWARSASPMFWQPLGELGIANNMVIAGGVRHATTFLQPLGELGIANNMVIAGGVRHATTFLQPLGELGIDNNMVIAGGVRHAPTFLQPLGELRWEEFIH
ncbi:glycoside hydrolase family 28 protein [Athelia psychrophila]|uniref:endo-polygalacturonase n=1 Tax=Athelia psychrophila TaxID=1759441 RepID=A0A166SME3_9AGAM|nr:glycoside hydrolase family 28 protein [Fibularhizoctonia sp. CBS 109695]